MNDINQKKVVVHKFIHKKIVKETLVKLCEFELIHARVNFIVTLDFNAGSVPKDKRGILQFSMNKLKKKNIRLLLLLVFLITYAGTMNTC